MRFNLKFKKSVLFLKFIMLLVIISSCNQSNKKNDKSFDHSNHKVLALNLNNEDINSSQFISELKESLKQEFFIPDSQFEKYSVKIDLLNNRGELGGEKEYQLLSEVMSVLPKPLLDTPYKAKHKILVNQLNKLYNETAKPAPKILHFIWLGGALGEIQKDYISAWALANLDYKIYIWYDSNNLLTYETQRSIKEYLELSLSKYKDANNYERIFAERVKEIQNNLYDYYETEKARDGQLTKDKIRVKFLKEVLYKDQSIATPDRKYKENIEKLEKDISEMSSKFKNIQFKNVDTEISDWNSKDYYNLELDLRSNFAAAADLLRVKLLKDIGGIYIDVDLLPVFKALYNFLETNLHLRPNISLNLRDIYMAFMEELIKNNKNIIPSHTDTNKHMQRLKAIIQSIQQSNLVDDVFKEKLNNFDEKLIELAISQKNEEINKIFLSLDEVFVREGEFRIVEGNNSFIVSHPVKNDSDWIKKIDDKMYNNYLQICSSKENNPKLKLKYKDLDTLSPETVKQFRNDGLIFDSDNTIVVSGPSLYSQVLRENLKLNYASSFDYFNKLFNHFTPESEDSSWFKRHGNVRKDIKNFIVQVGNEENTKIAAENIFNKLIDTADLYSMNNNEFKIIDQDEDYNKFLFRNRNRNITLHLIGHAAENSNGNMTLGGLDVDTIVENIKKNIFSGENKQLDYISIVSCNPTGNPNETKLIETFSKNLLNKLNEEGIHAKIISIRTTFVRIDANGDKYYSHGEDYTGHREGDKIYILRVNEQEFIPIKANYLSDEITEKYIKDIKKSLSTFSEEIKYLSEEGASGPLGELPLALQSLQKSYNLKNLSNSLALKIKTVTKALRLKHKISDNFAPFFSSFDPENKVIHFINMETAEYKKNIPLEEHDAKIFEETWEILKTEMKNLHSIRIKTKENGVMQSYSDADGLGLTPLFVAQTLFSAFKSLNEQENVAYDPSLRKVLQVQAYLFYSQLSIEVFNKITQVEKIVTALIRTKIIVEDESMVSNLNQVFSRLNAARYIGSGFIFANVALDAFEFSYSNDMQKPIFATQFSSDSINAITSLASLSLGEGVASSVLGYLGTPLAGLAIGFTGFATAAVEAQEGSIQIAKFFNEFLKDHSRIGNLNTCSEKLNVISLAHSSYTKNSDNTCASNLNSAVIREVDLRNDDKIILTYGSHLMFKTKNWDKGLFNGYYSNFQGSSQFPEADKIEKFNIRESLNLPSTSTINTPLNSVIILPFLMEKTISYSYSYTPGIMTRHNSELSTIETIAKNRKYQFVFRYFVDLFEYSIRNLSFETKNAEIKIFLGTKEKTLITPNIPLEYHNKVLYNIEGNNGNYTLVIAKNANYNIISGNNDKWIFDVSSLNIDFNYVRRGKFKIGDTINLNITGKLPNDILIKAAKKTYKINPDTGVTTELIEIENNENNNTEILENLKNISAKLSKHDGIIKINKYFANGISKIAWYDMKSEEIFSPYMLNEKFFNYNQIQFLGRNNNIIYYFDPQSRLIFQQNLLINDKPNTIPLAKVHKNSDPYYNSHDGLLIYKIDIERSMPENARKWEYTVARNVSDRYLLQINTNSNENHNSDLIEEYLKNQKAFNIKQAVKVTSPNNELIGWYLKKNKEISTDKFITVVSKTKKEIENPEYAGYVKKNNGDIIYFFTSRDSNTKKLKLFKKYGNNGNSELVEIPRESNFSQGIISVSLINNRPIILTSKRFLYSFDQNGELILTGINFALSSDATYDLNSIIKNIISNHTNHEKMITIVDSSGSLAWYDFSKDIFILFDAFKKYIGKNDRNIYYFIDNSTNKIYFKELKPGNLKNYSLALVNNKLFFKNNIKNEEFKLAMSSVADIKIYNDNKEIIDQNDERLMREYQYLHPFIKERERVETTLAKAVYERIIQKSEYIAEQNKLDAQMPQDSLPRRSILFVNDGWYNSAIEISIQNERGEIKKFHSWWGQKSNFTLSPLIPIDTVDIKVSIQSFFLGWSNPFFVRSFKLSDLPLCINTHGTLFLRNVTTRNCNDKY